MPPLQPDELHALLFGCAHRIAADLHINARTVQRWKAGQTPPPHMVKLLRIRYGDISGLLGPDWQGFHFGKDGLFYHPFFKYGFAPGELRALFFTAKEVNWYRQEFKKMRAELAHLKSNAWAADKLRSMSRSSQTATSTGGR